MPVLRKGATGPAVKKLQKKLKELGLNPGRIDGAYGPATKAAVREFQRNSGLPADGIAGPRTLAALRLKQGWALSALLLPKTVAVVSKMFSVHPFRQYCNKPPVHTHCPGKRGTG